MEIIPKPKGKIPPLEKIFLYFSIFVFLCTVFSFFYLKHLENSKRKEISQLEEKISQLKTPQIQNAEKEILKYQKKISYFSELIKDYLFYSKIFPYLEERIHKKIYFSEIDFDFENSKILLLGESPDFYTLGEQMEIFKNTPSFQPQLKEFKLGKEGKVDFKIEIVFQKDILK